MTLLSKQQILASDKKKTVDVPVKEWGGNVRLQEMSASERDTWESQNLLTDTITNDDGSEVERARWNPKHVRARLLVRCLVGEDGARLFTDDEVASLGSLSASTIDKLVEKARKLNGIGVKDLEEIEKNSEAGPSAGFSSSSANASA